MKKSVILMLIILLTTGLTTLLADNFSIDTLSTQGVTVSDVQYENGKVLWKETDGAGKQSLYLYADGEKEVLADSVDSVGYMKLENGKVVWSEVVGGIGYLYLWSEKVVLIDNGNIGSIFFINDDLLWCIPSGDVEILNKYDGNGKKIVHSTAKGVTIEQRSGMLTFWVNYNGSYVVHYYNFYSKMLNGGFFVGIENIPPGPGVPHFDFWYPYDSFQHTIYIKTSSSQKMKAQLFSVSRSYTFELADYNNIVSIIRGDGIALWYDSSSNLKIWQFDTETIRTLEIAPQLFIENQIPYYLIDNGDNTKSLYTWQDGAEIFIETVASDVEVSLKGAGDQLVITHTQNGTHSISLWENSVLKSLSSDVVAGSVLLDNGIVVWRESGLSGTTIKVNNEYGTTSVSTGVTAVSYINIIEDFVIWSEEYNGRSYLKAFSGGHNYQLSEGFTGTTHVGLDNGKIFWSETGADGAHAIYVWSADNGAKLISSGSGAVDSLHLGGAGIYWSRGGSVYSSLLDGYPPVIDIEKRDNQGTLLGDGDFTAGNVVFSALGDDADVGFPSGMDENSWRYIKTGAETGSGTGSTVTVNTEGETFVTFFVSDTGGNEGNATASVFIDKTAPVVSPSITTQGITSGVWTGAASVYFTATASDAVNTRAGNDLTIRYSFDDTATYDSAMAFSGSGNISRSTGLYESSVYFWAQDGAGNISPRESLSIKIDKEKPEVSAGTIFEAAYFENTLLLTFPPANDGGGSGINGYTWQYFIPDTTYRWMDFGLPDAEGRVSIDTASMAEGSYTLMLKVKDLVGNESDPEYFTFIIDRNDPSIDTLEFVSSSVNNNLVISTLSASDTRGAVDTASWQYRFDGAGDFAALPAAGDSGRVIDVTALGEGDHFIEIKVKDSVGRERVDSKPFIIDRTAPVIDNGTIVLHDTSSGKVIDINDFTAALSVDVTVRGITDWYTSGAAAGEVSDLKWAVTTAGEAPETGWNSALDNSSFTISGTYLPVQKMTYYLFIRPVDWAGNEAASVLARSIRIDRSPVGPPEISSSHPRAKSVTDAVPIKDVSFYFQPKDVGSSGVNGYYYELKEGIDTQNQAVLDGNGTGITGFSTGSSIRINDLADNGEGAFYYLEVWSESGSGIRSSYPARYRFRIDSTPPKDLIVRSSSHVDSNVVYSRGVSDFYWMRPSDLTGVKGYFYYYSDKPVYTDIPEFISQDWNESRFNEQGWFYSAADGVTEYLKLDLAGALANSDNPEPQGGSLWLAVCAVDYAGNKKYDQIQVTFNIAVPEIGSFTAGLGELDGSVIVSWNPFVNSGSINRLEMRLAELANGDVARYITEWTSTDPDDLNATFNGLNPGSDYRVFIRAIDTSVLPNIANKVIDFVYPREEVPEIVIVEPEITPFTYNIHGYRVTGTAYGDNPAETEAFVEIPDIFNYRNSQGEDLENNLLKLQSVTGHPFDSGSNNGSYTITIGDYDFTGRGVTFSRTNGLVFNELTLVRKINASEEREFVYQNVRIDSPSRPVFDKTGEYHNPDTGSVPFSYVTQGWEIISVANTSLDGFYWSLDEGAIQPASWISAGISIQDAEGVSSSIKVYEAAIDSDGAVVGGRLELPFYLELGDKRSGGQYLEVTKAVFDGDKVIVQEARVIFDSSFSVENEAGEDISDVVYAYNFFIDKEGEISEAADFYSTSFYINSSAAGYSLKIEGLRFSDNELFAYGEVIYGASGLSNLRFEGYEMGYTGLSGQPAAKLQSVFTGTYHNYAIQGLQGVIRNDGIYFPEVILNLGSFKSSFGNISLYGLLLSLEDQSIIQGASGSANLTFVPAYGADCSILEVALESDAVYASVMTATPPEGVTGDFRFTDVPLIAGGGLGASSKIDSLELIIDSFETTAYGVVFNGTAIIADSMAAMLPEQCSAGTVLFGEYRITGDAAGPVEHYGGNIYYNDGSGWDFELKNGRLTNTGFYALSNITLPAAFGSRELEFETFELLADGSYISGKTGADKGFIMRIGGWKTLVAGLALDGSTITADTAKVMLYSSMGGEELTLSNLVFSSRGVLQSCGTSVDKKTFISANGFKVETQSYILDGDGISISGKIFLPDALGDNQSILFQGNEIELNSNGVLKAEKLDEEYLYSVAGLDITGKDFVFDAEGLSIGLNTINIGTSSFQLGDVQFYPDGDIKLNGRMLNNMGALDIMGWSFGITDARLNERGLNLKSFITLPEFLGGHSIYFNGLTVYKEGGVLQLTSDVAVPEIAFKALDCAFLFRNVTFNEGVFKIGYAEITLPDSLENKKIRIHGLSIDSNGRFILGGSSIDPFSLWGYTFYLSDLSFANDKIVFEGSLRLPDDFAIQPLQGHKISINTFAYDFGVKDYDLDVSLDEAVTVPLFDSWDVKIEGVKLEKTVFKITQGRLYFPKELLPNLNVDSAGINEIVVNLENGAVDIKSIDVKGLVYTHEDLAFNLNNLDISQNDGLVLDGNVTLPDTFTGGFGRGVVLNVNRFQVRPDFTIGDIDASCGAVTFPFNDGLGFTGRLGIVKTDSEFSLACYDAVFKFTDSFAVKDLRGNNVGVDVFKLNIGAKEIELLDASFTAQNNRDFMGLPIEALSLSLKKAGLGTPLELRVGGNIILPDSIPAVGSKKVALGVGINADWDILEVKAELPFAIDTPIFDDVNGLHIKSGSVLRTYLNDAETAFVFEIENGSVYCPPTFGVEGLRGSSIDIETFSIDTAGVIYDCKIGVNHPSFAITPDLTVENFGLGIGTLPGGRDLLISLTGDVVLPVNAPKGIAGKKVSITAFEITSSGVIQKVDTSYTATGVDSMMGINIEDFSLGLTKTSSTDPFVITGSGKMVIPSDFPAIGGDKVGMTVGVNSNWEIEQLKASLTLLENRPVFPGDTNNIHVKAGSTIKAYVGDTGDRIFFEILDGTVYFPSNYGVNGLRNSSITIDNFLVDHLGTIETFSIDWDFASLPITDDLSIKNGNLALAIQNGVADFPITFKGTLLLPSNTPDSLGGKEVVIEQCRVLSKSGLDILEASYTASANESFMGLPIYGLSLDVSKAGVASPVELDASGSIMLPESFPAFGGEKVAMSLAVNSNWDVESFKAELPVTADTPIFDDVNSLHIKSGSVLRTYLNDAETAFVFEIENGSVYCPPTFGVEGLRGSSIDIETFSIDTAGVIYDCKIGVNHSSFAITPDLTVENFGLGIGTLPGGRDLLISLTGDVVLPANAPKGIAGKKVSITAFEITSSGVIQKVDTSYTASGVDSMMGINIEDFSLGLTKTSSTDPFVITGSGKMVIPSDFPAIGGDKVGMTVSVNSNWEIEQLKASLTLLENRPVFPDETNNIHVKAGSTIKAYVGDTGDKVFFEVKDGYIYFPDNYSIEGLRKGSVGISRFKVDHTGIIHDFGFNAYFPDLKVTDDFRIRKCNIGVDIEQGVSDFPITMTGDIVLPDSAPDSLAGNVIEISAFTIRSSGVIEKLDASYSMSQKTFMGLPVDSFAVSLKKESRTAPVELEVGGQMVLPANFPAVGGEEISLSVGVNSDWQFTKFDAELTTLTDRKFSDDPNGMYLKSGARFKAALNSSKTAILFGVQNGNLVFPQTFPVEGFRGMTLKINHLSIDTKAQIQAIDVGAAWDQFNLTDELIVKNCLVRMGVVPDGTEPLMSIGGSIVLPSSFPAGIAGKEVRISELSVTTKGEVTINAGLGNINTNLFGVTGLNLENGSIGVKTGAANEFIFSVGGKVRMPQGLPAGLGGSAINIKAFDISSTRGLIDLNIGYEPGVSSTFEIMAGVDARFNSIAVSKDGFSASASIIIKPGTFGFKYQTVTTGTFAMDWTGKITRIDAKVASASIDLWGFNVGIKDLTFNPNGVSLASAVITLPAALNSQQVQVVNAGFNVNSGFYGEIQASKLEFIIAGCTFIMYNPDFNKAKNNIEFSKVELVLPQALTGARIAVNGLSLGASGISITGGRFALPDFTVAGGLGFKRIFVELQLDGSQYTIGGGGAVMVPGLGELSVQVAFTNISGTYPMGLKYARFDYIVSGLGLPVAGTGIYINGVKGAIAFGPPGHEMPAALRHLFSSGKRLMIGCYMRNADGSFTGAPEVWINIDNWDWGVYGNFTMLQGFVNADVVASMTGRYGFEGNLRVAIVYKDTQGNEKAGIRGAARIHIWDEGGTKICGDVSASVFVKQGAGGQWWLPPLDVGLSVGVQFGDFKVSGRHVRGIKGYLGDLPIIGQVGFFGSPGGDFAVGGVSQYALYDQAARAAGQFRNLSFRSTTEGGFVAGNGRVSAPDGYLFQVPGAVTASVPTKTEGLSFDVITDEPVLEEFEIVERIFFDVQFSEGNPVVSAVSPSGKVYTMNSPDVEVLRGEEGLVMAVLSPEPGDWSVTVGGLSREKYSVKVFGKKIVPEIEVNTPAYEEMRVEHAINIEGNVKAGPESSVRLYVSREKGSPLGREIDVLSLDGAGDFTYTLDISNYEEGVYYIYVGVDDGSNPEKYAFAPGSIWVQPEKDALQQVVNFTAGLDDGAIRIAFDDPANGDLATGYELHIKDILTGAQESVLLGAVFNTTVSWLDENSSYQLWVTPYDHNKNNGPASNRVEIDFSAHQKDLRNDPVMDNSVISAVVSRGDIISGELGYFFSNNEETGTAQDFIDISLVEAPEWLFVHFEDDRWNGFTDNTIGYQLHVPEGTVPGEYTIVLTVENMGNRELNSTITFDITVNYSVGDIHNIIPESWNTLDAVEFDIYGEGFDNSSMVYIGDDELTIIEKTGNKIRARAEAGMKGGAHVLWVESPAGRTGSEVQAFSPDYSIINYKNNTYIQRGGSGYIYWSLEGENRFSGDARFSVTNLPSGFTAAFENSYVSEGEIGVLRIDVDPNTRPGSYPVSFEGDNGNIIAVTIFVSDEYPQPHISSLSSEKYFRNDEITLFGYGFGTDGAVYLNDLPVTVTSYGPDMISIILDAEEVDGLLSVKPDSGKTGYVEIDALEENIAIYPQKETLRLQGGDTVSLPVLFSGYAQWVDVEYATDSRYIQVTQDQAGLVLNGYIGFTIDIADGIENGIYQLTVTARGGETVVTRDIPIVIGDVFEFVTSSLPSGKEGCAYNGFIMTENGEGDVVYSLIAGDLPVGITLSSDGVLSGKASAQEEAVFTIEAADDGGRRIQKTYVLQIESMYWGSYWSNPGRSGYTDISVPAEKHLAWQKSIAGSGGMIITGSDRVFVCVDNDIKGYDKASGDYLFTIEDIFENTKFDNGDEVWKQTIYDGGIVYVLTGTGILKAFNADFGEYLFVIHGVDRFSVLDNVLYCENQGVITRYDGAAGLMLDRFADLPQEGGTLWNGNRLFSWGELGLYGLADDNGSFVSMDIDLPVVDAVCENGTVAALTAMGRVYLFSGGSVPEIIDTAIQTGKLALSDSRLSVYGDAMVKLYSLDDLTNEIVINTQVEKVIFGAEKVITAGAQGLGVWNIYSGKNIWNQDGSYIDAAINGEKIYALTAGGVIQVYKGKVNISHPETEILISPAQPDGKNGYYKTQPVMSLISEDLETYVERLFFEYPGNLWKEYSEPVTLPDGNYSIAAFGVDTYGYREPDKVSTLAVDTIAPEVNAGWSGSSVTEPVSKDSITMVLNGQDSISGMDAIVYRVTENNVTAGWTPYEEPVDFTADGRFFIQWYGEDKAGNLSEVGNNTIAVDMLPPEADARLEQLPHESIVSLSGWDRTAGVDYIEYRIDDGPVLVYGDAVHIPGIAYHEVTYRAVDKVGGTGEWETIAVPARKGGSITTIFKDSSRNPIAGGEVYALRCGYDSPLYLGTTNNAGRLESDVVYGMYKVYIEYNGRRSSSRYRYVWKKANIRMTFQTAKLELHSKGLDVWYEGFDGKFFIEEGGSEVLPGAYELKISAEGIDEVYTHKAYVYSRAEYSLYLVQLLTSDGGILENARVNGGRLDGYGVRLLVRHGNPNSMNIHIQHNTRYERYKVRRDDSRLVRLYTTTVNARCDYENARLVVDGKTLGYFDENGELAVEMYPEKRERFTILYKGGRVSKRVDIPGDYVTAGEILDLGVIEGR